MLRVSREDRRNDRWLYPKILLFVTGASVGIAGMAAGIDWLVTVGILILIPAFLLRILGRRTREE